MDFTVFADLVSRVGVPLALLAFFAYYHARVVKAKDDEIARISEQRVKEARENTDKLLTQNTSFMELLGEVDSTLKLVDATVNDLNGGGPPRPKLPTPRGGSYR
jgi:hypothetical protein